MLNIVSAVSEASKERNYAEIAVKAGMTDAAVQTPCDLGDFQALISTANDGTIDPTGRQGLCQLFFPVIPSTVFICSCLLAIQINEAIPSAFPCHSQCFFHLLMPTRIRVASFICMVHRNPVIFSCI